MKPQLFIFPILSAALMVGCQSDSQDSSKVSPGASGGAAAKANGFTASTSSSAQKLSQPTIRINAGAAAVKDSTGVEWLGETGFEGGDVIERPDLQITNTKQPEIYRSEHYS